MGAEGLFVECFQAMEDPRMVNKCRHELLDIIIIAVCATIANADGWEDMAVYGESKAEWLQQWLKLPNGIPSADTFRRVFEHLEAEAFERCFLDWVQRVFDLTAGQVIAIDGKTARGTCDKTGQGGLHLVSAWATANRLTLAQVKVADKANEIVAIPQLLQMLMVQGCIVTIDAIGCQKQIVNAIRATGRLCGDGQGQPAQTPARYSSGLCGSGCCRLVTAAGCSHTYRRNGPWAA
jgi:hypothetical protein